MAPRAFDPDRDAWTGARDGTLTAVVYSDFSCPSCRRAFRTGDALVERMRRKGRFVYRHVAAPARAPASERAALAAIAAQSQGAFWEMNARLFDDDDLSDAAIRAHAAALGLDLERFDRDRAGPEAMARLRADMADAAAAGVAVTPSLFLNGRYYDGPWDATAVMEALDRPVTGKVTAAFQDFFNWAAAGGVALILTTLAALLFVNLGFSESYAHLLRTEFALSLGAARFGLPLEAWVNDALMAVFFLLVGIEIKREILEGELSDPASAALPLIAALGGMVAPALIYASLNAGGDAAQGWGVPMATDIAFTIGLIALLGTRAPAALKVFVSALAVADDLGAILVIAVFYGHGFHVDAFFGAVVMLALMIGFNLAKIYARWPYVLAGVLLWAFVHESGLHATLAGVLTAAAIPSRPQADIESISAQASALLETGSSRGVVKADLLSQLDRAIDRLREPGYHVERRLQGITNFLILPLFAFFNTGIVLSAASFTPLAPESLGVVLGLVIGKPLGIAGLSAAALWLGWARLPTGVSLEQIVGAGFLAGVGFTMSIFIATAAFDGQQLEAVKLSVLIGSTLSAAIGMALLLRSCKPAEADPAGAPPAV